MERKFQIETFSGIKNFGCDSLKSAIETAKIIKRTKSFKNTKIIISSYLAMPSGYCKKWNQKYKVEKTF
ncbi:hypothetical protein [Flavobacterium sp.]|uniref:hypothetical protein n=1 Tax=Flavobacterium sp. TaxID=239 RepID=UPI0038FC5E19